MYNASLMPREAMQKNIILEQIGFWWQKSLTKNNDTRDNQINQTRPKYKMKDSPKQWLLIFVGRLTEKLGLDGDD